MAELKGEVVADLLAANEESMQTLREIAHGGEAGASPYFTDACILRFLVGYNLNVEKAGEALQNTVAWRIENNMEEIRAHAISTGQTEWPGFQQICHFLPQNMHFNEAKDGSVFSVENTGQSDPNGLFKNITGEEWLLFQKYHMEYKMHILGQITEATGVLAKTFRVMNLKGLGFSHLHRPCLDMIKVSNKQIELNYPEVMGKCFIVNAPMVFKAIWVIVKPWLPARTLLKIEVLGAGYQDRLQELVEVQKIPCSLGGKGECPGIDGPW